MMTSSGCRRCSLVCVVAAGVVGVVGADRLIGGGRIGGGSGEVGVSARLIGGGGCGEGSRGQAVMEVSVRLMEGGGCSGRCRG